ncbi:amino acid/polyamine/organocation transporter, APC superfamily (TC 2.A.3) [Saccharopolyspora kobensis]|uniref:Amino acid/polyamine/organocation transporter, APC superfamily n=1 Tax=Saccharopolyspora kobensis TaxID=146035 RepID=A0A1H6CBI5_9PSEU|nr:amino acid permease [Saccharopolyspora kobensis]SEG70252.1 amino acid/polyamine/organocation transporter, APC superfamily (TC 2.A.3) [Saccharopolyspora kobensis]SFC34553.1 amino acid/polyamine/organocation transporter, APC superfamily [Saccharopolyspora kobensis]
MTSPSLQPGRGIFRRKPIDTITEDTGGGGLQKSLGLWQLTAIGVGGIIGAGIFSLAGAVANEKAGPAVLISFLIAGIASAAAAFSYAEFAGMIPKAGSAYTYGYAVLGEVVGWLIGWDLLLEYTAIVAVVAIGISGYFNELVGFIGLDLPAWMMGAPGTENGAAPPGSYKINLFAALLCLLIAFILNQGMKSAARFETFLVYLKVGVVLLVIVVGAFHIDAGNYNPFFPYGISGAFAGAATVFFAVFGYDAMSTAAEESKDAQRHMPKAIMYSLGISMVLYVLACLVLTGMIPFQQISSESAFASAFSDVGLPVLGAIIAIGAILGILTVLFTFMMGVTRVGYAMSRDGLLPKWFAKTHPVRKVPSRFTWLIGIASALIAGLLPIGEAAELTNIGILLAFVIVCAAVIVLRYKRPDLPRGFKCPGMPIVPIIGIVFSIWLVTFLAPETWLRFAAWFAIGLVIYFAYGYRKSKLNEANADSSEQ